MTAGSGGTTYNQASDCDCVEVANPGSTMEQVYEYYSDRNLKRIRGTNTPWLNQDFVYDSLNRLSQAKGEYGTINYTYDRVGNRLARTVDNQAESYIYFSNTNQLASVAGENTVNYSYDNNGNPILIGNKAYVYNQSSRLVEVRENGNTIAEYEYNAMGQRLIKKVGDNTTIFHYDFDGNIVAESRPDGTMIFEYLYLGSNRLAMVDAGTQKIYYCLNNYLGTPVMMTDDSGMIEWEANYKPFGEADVNPNAEAVNNFRFPGQYFDQETGLHYNYHRYYDPKTGRYLTPDPIGLVGGINLYLYAALNPINSYDNLGLKDWNIHRKGLSLSLLIIGGSGQLIKFRSSCENNRRITKSYLVVGLGLTFGLEAYAWGNTRGYFGGINVYANEPRPYYAGILISGISGGVGIIGGTLGSAILDFASFAEVYGVETGNILGLSLFNFEGQLYIPWDDQKIEHCCE
jgi:RHS repeat-associated protein